MKKSIAILSTLLLLGGVSSCSDIPTSSSEGKEEPSSYKESTSSTEENTSSKEESTSSSQSNSKYGELNIPDVTIYTNFPDKPLPTFTNTEYAGEITYEVLDNSIITYKDGYFSATGASTATVKATTQYHETTFKVTSKVYSDIKGDSTTTFYLNRVSSMESRWKNEGKKQNGTIFIGDSFFDTEFWSDFYTTFEDNENVYTHGVSSSTTTDWEIFAKRLIYPANPKNIVMHCGTNNIYDDGEKADTVIENTKRFLNEVHSRLPETKIYYFAIEPRTYGIGGSAFTQYTYDIINTVNTTMKTYCEANEHLVFVDATPNCYTSGITVNSDFFRDGTHPKLENYLKYADLLVEAGLNLNINRGETAKINIDVLSGVAATNNNIKHNNKAVINNYSISGKLKIGETGGNPHIQFSFDDTNFQNRFLIWDNNTDGTFNLGYACNGNHMAQQNQVAITKNTEITWELVTTTKHSYLYINDTLQMVFRNVNPTTALLIGSEQCKVNFYDITTITSSDDATEYNKVLERSEITTQESNSSTTKEVIVFNK